MDRKSSWVDNFFQVILHNLCSSAILILKFHCNIPSPMAAIATWLPHNYDLRSAKTRICRLETNLANSSKHTHDSRLSNKYPPTDRDLFAIGESCVVDIESNSVARWCVLVSGFLGMSHGDFELVGITVELKWGVGEWMFVVVNDGGSWDRSYYVAV